MLVKGPDSNPTKSNQRITTFASWTEYVNYAEGVKDDPNAPSIDECSSQREGDEDFFGVGEFTDQIKFARSGWSPGRAKIKAITEKLKIELLSGVKDQYRYDVGGSIVDIGRFLGGDPECMLEFHQQLDTRPDGKLIPLKCYIAQNCNISESTVIARGSAIVALVDILEDEGFRVEILGVANISNQLIYQVPIKNFADPVDIDLLGFSLVHAGCFRRLGFACMEREPEAIRSEFSVPHGGYGRSEHPTLNDSVIDLENSQDWDITDVKKLAKWVEKKVLPFTREGQKDNIYAN